MMQFPSTLLYAEYEKANEVFNEHNPIRFSTGFHVKKEVIFFKEFSNQLAV